MRIRCYGCGTEKDPDVKEDIDLPTALKKLLSIERRIKGLGMSTVRVEDNNHMRSYRRWHHLLSIAGMLSDDVEDEMTSITRGSADHYSPRKLVELRDIHATLASLMNDVSVMANREAAFERLGYRPDEGLFLHV